MDFSEFIELGGMTYINVTKVHKNSIHCYLLIYEPTHPYIN